MTEILRHPIADPADWRVADVADRNRWTHRVTPAHVAEIEAALDGVKRRGLPLFEIAREDFPLPTLSKLLARVQGELEGGLGFAMIRGLPVEHWSEEDAKTVFWGLGAHLGFAEPQDADGNLIHSVRNTGQAFTGTDNVRTFQTNDRSTWHNDGADIFMLLCLQQGRAGGSSELVSSVAAFNEIARRRPDLAEVLQQDFHTDLRGYDAGGGRCQILPVYIWHEGHLSAVYKGRYIHAAQRFPEVPRLTAAQKEALELLEEICIDPEFCLEFELEPGDIEIANNYVTLHGRKGYDDWPEPERRRHLLRLWLTIPNGRPLPPSFAATREFAATYARRMAPA